MNVNKRQSLIKSIKRFNSGDKTPEEYFELIICIISFNRQEWSWYDMKSVIDEAFGCDINIEKFIKL